MKFSLTLGSRRTLNRSEARGCLAANIALPGAGSLAAGRAVGYLQMAAAFAGLIVSVLTGVPMIRWCLSNWVRLSNPASDPSDVLIDLWLHLRWPLVGIGLFVIATLWSVATGLRLLAQAPRDGVPPRIEPR